MYIRITAIPVFLLTDTFLALPIQLILIRAITESSPHWNKVLRQVFLISENYEIKN